MGVFDPDRSIYIAAAEKIHLQNPIPLRARFTTFSVKAEDSIVKIPIPFHGTAKHRIVMSTSWPHQQFLTPTPFDFATAGLTYLGSLKSDSSEHNTPDDTVVCLDCFCQLSNWEEGMNPWQRHYEEGNRYCSFVANCVHISQSNHHDPLTPDETLILTNYKFNQIASNYKLDDEHRMVRKRYTINRIFQNKDYPPDEETSQSLALNGWIANISVDNQGSPSNDEFMCENCGTSTSLSKFQEATNIQKLHDKDCIYSSYKPYRDGEDPSLFLQLTGIKEGSEPEETETDDTRALVLTYTPIINENKYAVPNPETPAPTLIKQKIHGAIGGNTRTEFQDPGIEIFVTIQPLQINLDFSQIYATLI